MSKFASIPKYMDFNRKRYTLQDAFVSKGTAERLKKIYKKKGYLVRIVQRGGIMHVVARYHVYVRK